MLRGNRLLFTALGLVAVITCLVGWWTFPISPTTQQFRYDSPRDQNYRPGGSQCEPSALAKIAGANIRLRKAEYCQKEAEEYRQSSDDLIQQTRAANAAQAQADIASQQLWTGWLQTLGGFLTLAAAIGAAIYARDAAKEGRRSANEAELSRKTFIGSERATLRPANGIDVTPAPNQPTRRGLWLNFTNHGRGNAIIRRIVWRTSDIGDWPDEFSEEEAVSHVIEAGKSTEIDPIYVFPTSPERFFTLGYIEYETLSGLSYRTHFCYLVARHRGSDGIVRVRDDFAELRPFPDQPTDT